jgi:peptidoglycan hydrolase-like protein with peptidoglycan-binding domain
VLLLALVSALTYRFPIGQPVTYQADMKFDGYLPILGIGQGKAEVKGTFEVVGKTETSARAKLTAFTVTFNGEKVPIDLDDAQKYVPGGTFTYSPTGQVSSWDAPTVVAPIRVPGLDLKHLPEVLFLPIAFPPAGIDDGKSFTLSLSLSGGKADYTVTLTGAGATNGADLTSFMFKVHQSYSDFEDDANQVVPERDAAAKVTTDVVGSGQGTFSSVGRFTSFTIDDVATSAAMDLQSKKVTRRKLARHLVVTS